MVCPCSHSTMAQACMSKLTQKGKIRVDPALDQQGSRRAHQQGLQQAPRARRPQVQPPRDVGGLLQEGGLDAVHDARVHHHVIALHARQPHAASNAVCHPPMLAWAG